MEKPVIFISWSGPQSREVAHVLKDFLCKIYHKLKSENIFISDSNIAGGNLWLETIRNVASLIRITIPCLTTENTKAPWIHYEVGLCSGLLTNEQNRCSEQWGKAIIPFLFNFDSEHLDSHLSMLSCHHLVSTTMMIEDETLRFQDLLYSLVQKVDSCMHHQGLSEYCHHFSDNECHIKQMCCGYVNTYAAELVKINQKYNKHDFYLSRPILGINKEMNIQISNIIEQIKREFQDKMIYASLINSEYDKNNLLESRIVIIKKSKSFILIYPQISDREILPPSSCFIEFGAALASKSRIFLCIQRGAKVPAFIQEKLSDEGINTDYHIHHFDNIPELYECLSNIIKQKP